MPFSRYSEGIIEAFLGPVADYGVAFEAHAQNVLIRMDRSSGSIKGWASRDLGSIKIHTPTLAKSGYVLTSIPPGSLIPTENEEEAWRMYVMQRPKPALARLTNFFFSFLNSIQFCLFHNHLNVFIYRLGVDRFAAWEMIRGKLDAFFARRSHQENSERLRAFLFAETIPQKAFMRMKFAQKAAQYEYTTVPNVLLERGPAGVALQRKKNALSNGIHLDGHVAVNGH